MLKVQHEAVGIGTQQYYVAWNVPEAYNGGNYGTFIRPERSYGDNDLCDCSYSGMPLEGGTWVDESFFSSHATVHTATNAFKQVVSDVFKHIYFLDIVSFLLIYLLHSKQDSTGQQK
jgi:hypothetical protein